MLCEISGKDIKAHYGPERAGDVRHSKASLANWKNFCGYNPKIGFQKGLGIVYRGYEHNINWVLL